VRQSDCPDVTVSGNARGTVSKLKGTPGKDIWLFGGGSLFRSLLGIGLVDTVEVSIIPVLLGGGIRLLPDPADRARLRLTKHNVYPKTGTVAPSTSCREAPPNRRRGRGTARVEPRR
jgi:dihydrofolate reductase